MEKNEGPYIIECVRDIMDDMGRLSWARQMTGPFVSFDEAHIWMETIGVKSFDTQIIHILSPPNKAVNP